MQTAQSSCFAKGRASKKSTCVERMCVVCRARKSKEELITVKKNKNGEFVFAEGYTEGRGASVCRSKTCIETAIKKRSFNRSFRCEVPTQIYELLAMPENMGKDEF